MWGAIGLSRLRERTFAEIEERDGRNRWDHWLCGSLSEGLQEQAEAAGDAGGRCGGCGRRSPWAKSPVGLLQAKRGEAVWQESDGTLQTDKRTGRCGGDTSHTSRRWWISSTDRVTCSPARWQAGRWSNGSMVRGQPRRVSGQTCFGADAVARLSPIDCRCHWALKRPALAQPPWIIECRFHATYHLPKPDRPARGRNARRRLRRSEPGRPGPAALRQGAPGPGPRRIAVRRRRPFRPESRSRWRDWPCRRSFPIRRRSSAWGRTTPTTPAKPGRRRPRSRSSSASSRRRFAAEGQPILLPPRQPRSGLRGGIGGGDRRRREVDSPGPRAGARRRLLLRQRRLGPRLATPQARRPMAAGQVVRQLRPHRPLRWSPPTRFPIPRGLPSSFA